MTTKEKMNPQKTARIAGFLYMLLVPLGLFGLMYVPSTLIVSGDAAATVNNIMASESLFRLGILSVLILQVINILVVVVLYRLLKPVNKTYAALMVILCLVMISINMLNELNHLAALSLLSGADYLTAFETNQLHAQVMLFFSFYGHGITLASIFWGLWLFPMGYLVIKSGFLPRILGVALIITCFGYLVDFFAFFLFPNFDATIGLYTGWGEILFPLWLLIKGVNVEQWEKRALEFV